VVSGRLARLPRGRRARCVAEHHGARGRSGRRRGALQGWRSAAVPRTDGSGTRGDFGRALSITVRDRSL
jgi:hypothetical protein